MRTSNLRMTAVAGALVVALGGCSTTSWNDMMSRMRGDTKTASSNQSTQASSTSNTSSTYGTSSAATGTSNTATGSSNTASTSSPSTYGTANTTAGTPNTASGYPSNTTASTSNTLAGGTTTAPPSMSMGSNGAYAQNSATGTGTTSAQNQANNDMSASSGSSYRSGRSMSGVTASTRDASLVREVQQALNDKGFNPGPIDGKWGPRTQAALKKFQNSQGIAASNKLDDQTLAALGVDASTMQTSQSGSASSSRNSGTSRGTSTSGQTSSSDDSSTRVSTNAGGQMQPQKH